MKKIIFVTAGILYVISFLTAGRGFNLLGGNQDYGPFDFVCLVASLLASSLIFIPVFRKILKSTESLSYKIIYTFILNLGIFGLSMLIWIIGGNILDERNGLARILNIISLSVLFAIIMLVIYLSLSNEDKQPQVAINKTTYSKRIIIFFTSIVVLLLLFLRLIH